MDDFLSIFLTVSTSTEKSDICEWLDLFTGEFPAFVFSLIPNDTFMFYLFSGFKKDGKGESP